MDDCGYPHCRKVLDVAAQSISFYVVDPYPFPHCASAVSSAGTEGWRSQIASAEQADSARLAISVIGIDSGFHASLLIEAYYTILYNGNLWTSVIMLGITAPIVVFSCFFFFLSWG